MLAKDTQAYLAISVATKEILEGIMICVDPSIGSQSSMPGWAIYTAGNLQDSGTIPIDHTASTPLRLQRLNYGIRQLIKKWDPDVMVYENITDVPFKGFSGRNLSSLQKALGAILSISGPVKYVGFYPASWKKLAREGYLKSDENDAIELGWVALQEATRIKEIEQKVKKRGKGVA